MAMSNIIDESEPGFVSIDVDEVMGTPEIDWRESRGQEKGLWYQPREISMRGEESMRRVRGSAGRGHVAL